MDIVFDARTVVDVLITVGSAIAVVVTLKNDMKWLRIFVEQHVARDDATHTQFRTELETLKDRVHNRS